MPEVRNDFRIVTDNFDQIFFEDALAAMRVAAINGLSVDQLDPSEVYELNDGYKKRKVNRSLALKYTGVDDTCLMRLRAEREQQFRQRVESWLGVENNLNSYGYYIPSYLPVLREQQPQSTPHRALLVGALTPDTVTEFVSTISLAFPQNECFVIDPEGIETPTASPNVTFIRGNGLELGNHITGLDSIHTNALFRFSEKQHNKIHLEGDMLPIFLSEAFKSLNPEGKLILIESVAGSLEDYLKLIGFKCPELEPAESFRTRKIMDRFLYQGLTEAKPSMTQVQKATNLIVATK